MSKFKVGDRVAIYTSCGRMIGRIVSIVEDRLTIFHITGGHTMEWHKKQCRKLIKKPTKQWRGKWMEVSAAAGYGVCFVPSVNCDEMVGKVSDLCEVKKK